VRKISPLISLKVESAEMSLDKFSHTKVSPEKICFWSISYLTNSETKSSLQSRYLRSSWRTFPTMSYPESQPSNNMMKTYLETRRILTSWFLT
jgi:hypothetical protein